MAILEPENQQLTTGVVDVQTLTEAPIFIGNNDRVASSESVGAQSSDNVK